MELAEQVAEYLLFLACRPSAEQTTTYTALVQHFGFPALSDEHRWHSSPMPRIFRDLDAEDRRLGHPLRTSVVVLKTKSTRLQSFPGAGYFKTLCAYRGVPFPKSALEKRLLHGAELKLLSKRYQTRRTRK
jgi:hypothetical protein